MGGFKKVYKFFSKICSALSYVSMAVTFMIMLLLMVDIILRYFFSSGLLGSLELIEMGMTIIIFCGFAYTQVERGHVNVDILINRIHNRRVRAFIDGFVYFFTAVISFALLYASFMKVSKEGATTGVLLIPLVPFEIIMGIGYIMLTIIFLLDSIREFLRCFGKEEPEEAESVMVPSH